MAGTIAQIRAALKTSLASFTDANKYGFEPKSGQSLRVIVSWPDSWDPHADLSGGRDIVVPVRFEVPWVDDESSDAKLMAYMNAAVAALEAATLTGVADSVRCLPFTDIGARRLSDETSVMQFVVPVEVYA
jgi:hypothetical protein